MSGQILLLVNFLENFFYDHLPTKKEALKRMCFLVYENQVSDLDLVIDIVYSEIINGVEI